MRWSDKSYWCLISKHLAIKLASGINIQADNKMVFGRLNVMPDALEKMIKLIFLVKN